jgi:D-sedoheptulose 7-phosphate isomerase
MDTTVRNLDDQAYRALRARAVLEGRTVGDLINEAIRAYLVTTVRPAASTLRAPEPEPYPEGNERLSREIDLATNYPALYEAEVLKAIETIDLEKVAEAIRIFIEARAEGRQIFVCGNGGSAATASHFVTDIVKGASFNRPARFRIMALTDSGPTIMAYSNDVGYECVFVEQLKNFVRPGDVVMAFSGSGNSPNVVRALEYGNSIGCRTIALTGRDGGKLGRAAQLNIQVSHPHMGRIEDVHMMVMHMICYYFMDAETSAAASTK